MIKRLSMLAATLLLAITANAAETFSTFGFSPADVDWTATTPVVKFDSSLGTLTKVTVTLDGEMSSFLNFVLEGAGTGTADFGTSVNLALASSAFGTNIPTDLLIGGFRNAFFDETHTVINGPLINTNNTLDTIDDTKFFSDLVTFDFLSDLAGFVGTVGTTFELTCAATKNFVVIPKTGAVGVFDSTDSTAESDCIGKFVYTFTPAGTNNTPEPGTMALVGLALAGMGFTARRRRTT